MSEKIKNQQNQSDPVDQRLSTTDIVDLVGSEGGKILARFLFNFISSKFRK